MRQSAFLLASLMLLSSQTAAADENTPPAAQPPQASDAGWTNNRHCLHETGTLIRPGRSGCLEGQNGTVYTRDALTEQAGTSVADFLRYDPDITIWHHR
ncbi:MAG: hypothetical protein P4L83_23640 [Nevskia sp.]|nr:hypothetical protein [Nevskia sp.]